MAYDSKLIKLLQIGTTLIFPLIILLKYYGWWQAILFHIISIMIVNFISGIIAPFFIKLRYANLIIILGMIIGCKGAIVLKNRSYEDEYYCAKVHYYNPNTENEGDSHLTVQIENNKVVKLVFPKGGWLDENHFDAPELNRLGEATVIDDRKYKYSVSDLEDGECEYSTNDFNTDGEPGDDNNNGINDDKDEDN